MKNMNFLKSNMILGTVFVLITGTISHFIYDWSGQNYILGTFLIPVLFYSYSGILGNHFLWLDIAVFALSVLLAFWASYRLTLCCRAKDYGNLFGLLVFVVLLCFLFFTYHAPALGLFADPTKQL